MPTPNGKPKRCRIPQRLLERRRAGKVTLREMALACGVSISVVWRELKRLGFPIGRPGGLPGGPTLYRLLTEKGNVTPTAD